MDKIVEIISDICKVICLLCLTFYSVMHYCKID